jgi:hypothetical protein
VAWLRVKRVAERADTSTRTVRRWMKSGLRHSRISGIPYISESALDEWMRAHEVADDPAVRIADDVLREL